MADDKFNPREAREGLPTGEVHKPSDAEIKARGRRNIAIALAVVGFVVLVYLTTFFRLAENIKAAPSVVG
jgi:hypothetical protein